ncbi:hypothetical protein [Pontibacter sp. G13]|uniref:hypothetical protein n=1 Tax=Pontibacter sp. G13 TaxID=3074898 RepID=UPI00288ABEF9|nr:hypothetical protein [Pontibacter sp. G13]WNJ20206.1 hypothetical protein RJD25_06975 [Pontibacter sp. G13]
MKRYVLVESHAEFNDPPWSLMREDLIVHQALQLKKSTDAPSIMALLGFGLAYSIPFKMIRCVIAPEVLGCAPVRNLVLWFSHALMFQPIWSPKIMDLLADSLAQQEIPPDKIRQLLDRVQQAFPAAMSEHSLPRSFSVSPHLQVQAHLLGLARAEQAPLIIDQCPDDYPCRIRNRFQVSIQSPDQFCAVLIQNHPIDCTLAFLELAQISRQSIRELLHQYRSVGLDQTSAFMKHILYPSFETP